MAVTGTNDELKDSALSVGSFVLGDAEIPTSFTIALAPQASAAAAAHASLAPAAPHARCFLRRRLAPAPRSAVRLLLTVTLAPQARAGPAPPERLGLLTHDSLRCE